MLGAGFYTVRTMRSALLESMRKWLAYGCDLFFPSLLRVFFLVLPIPAFSKIVARPVATVDR